MFKQLKQKYNQALDQHRGRKVLNYFIAKADVLLVQARRIRHIDTSDINVIAVGRYIDPAPYIYADPAKITADDAAVLEYIASNFTRRNEGARRTINIGEPFTIEAAEQEITAQRNVTVGKPLRFKKP